MAGQKKQAGAPDVSDQIEQMRAEMNASFHAIRDQVNLGMQKIEAMREKLGELRFVAAPEIRAVTSDGARQLLAKNHQQRFRVLTDYQKGNDRLRGGHVISGHHYQHLASYVDDGLLIEPVSEEQGV